MKGLKFEGEALNIHEKQLKFITGVLEKRGFENGTVKVESVGKEDDNYGSSIKRFTVEKNGDTFKMIVKIAPVNPQMRITIHSLVTFKNEGVMYTKILPKFAELETNVCMPRLDKLRFAECYGVFMEEPHEIILLEDLKESNFVILDKFEPLNDDTVKLVLKNFAKFHSLSFVLKNKDLDLYKSFIDIFGNPWKSANEIPGMNAYFTSLEEEVLDFVEKDKYKKIIKGSLTRISKNIVENSNRNGRFSIIHQGDAWTNNIMFTVENNKTDQCCMIDYQMSNESNPAADILYMIFNCTDYPTRSTEYNNWIDYYHTQLDNCLKKFSLNADDVYHRDVLDKDLKRMGKIAFGQAIMAAAVLVRETNEAAKMKDAMKETKTDNKVASYKISNLSASSVKRYKQKLDGLLKSYEEIGFDNY